MKPPLNLKKLSGNILIGAGTLLVALFLIYEAVSFPWRWLFVKWGFTDEASIVLEDPKPLGDIAEIIPDTASPPEAMPSQPDTIALRPKIDTVQLGVIKLPGIMVSENIVEGSGDELYYGVGHVRGSAMPGEFGNCVLAGHRNYIGMRPFRYLDKIEIGNLVYVTDAQNTYTYEVFKIFTVTPEDKWVLHPQDEEDYLLTLLTCTPVLSLTDRLIVWCRLTDTAPLA